MAAIRRINLLPPEIAIRRRGRQLVGLVVIVGVSLIALMGVFFVVQRARLAAVRSDVTRQQNRNSALQQSVNQLQQFQGKQTELESKQALLNAISKNEILWSSVLEDIALVLPADDWLTQFSAATNAGTLGSQTIGQLSVGGCTLIPSDGDYLNVARFLDAMAKPPSFNDPFLSRAEKQKAVAGAPSTGAGCPVQFNSTIPVTTQALRASRGKGRTL